MAGELIYLEAIVGADISSFRRGMAEVRGEIAETTGLSGGLIGLGTSLLPVTIGMAALGAVSLKVFSDFDSGMRNINSIMQLPEAQFQKLSDDVLKFGENTRNGATAASQALYTIVSAGFGVKDTAEAMKLLDVATQGAEAGLADTNTVAQVLAQSLLAYGRNADSAAHFMDVLTQTVNLGVGSMDDVAGSIGQVINIASLAGVSFDDLGGSAAFLTQRGMSMSNAMVSINQILSQMVKPPEALAAVFAQLGVSGGTELIAKMGGLGGALKAIAGVTGDTAEGLGKVFTNVRALRGAASILGNFDDYTSLMEDFGASIDGVTGRAQQQQLKSLASQFDYLKSHVMGFLTVVGKDLAPLFGKFTDILGEFFMNLSDLDPVVIQTAVAIGMVAAAIPVVIILLGALLSPIGQLIIVGAALVKAWNDNFLGIQDAVKNALPVWTTGLNNLHLKLLEFYGNASQFLFDLTANFNKYFSDDLAKLLKDVLVGNWEGVRQDLENIYIDIEQDLSDHLGLTAIGNIILPAVTLIHDILFGRWSQIKNDLGILWTNISTLLTEKIITPLTDFFNSNILPGIKQGLGDLFKGINPDDLVGIAAGLGGILIPLALLATIAAVSALPTFILAVAAGLSALLIPLLPILLPLGLIVGIFLAWKNNTWGLRDAINALGDTLRAFIKDPLGTLGEFFKNNQGILNLLLPTNLSGGGSLIDTIVNQIVPPPSNSSGIPFPGLDDDLLPLISPRLPSIIETRGGSGTPFPNSGGGGWGTGQNGNYSTQNVQINIHSNDPDYILREIRRRGIDLTASRRG